MKIKRPRAKLLGAVVTVKMKLSEPMRITRLLQVVLLYYVTVMVVTTVFIKYVQLVAGITKISAKAPPIKNNNKL